MVNKEKLKQLGLQRFYKDFDNIENQHLNLIYDPNFDHVVERYIYERTIGLMEWKCAICGETILSDRNRYDVENFVCGKCKEQYNNSNSVVDRRILDSRTKMFKTIENRLYDELESILNGGNI